eukprot:Skav225591  [mRNA]  locus=scaffold1527:19065:19361:- [translate_table: standard]
MVDQPCRTKVVHMSQSPRVASPVRFIAQTRAPVLQPMLPGTSTLPTSTTFWFPRTVSVSPQPVRQPPRRNLGEPNLAKESTNPQACTEGWASEPTSSL